MGQFEHLLENPGSGQYAHYTVRSLLSAELDYPWFSQCKRVHIFIAQFAIFRVFQEVNGS